MEERRELRFIKFMGKRENNLLLAVVAIEEAAGCNVGPFFILKNIFQMCLSCFCCCNEIL